MKITGQTASLFLAEEPPKNIKKLAIGKSHDEDILAWKNRHVDEPIALIGNGDSVRKQKLGRISCVTMGLNRAWELGEWDYLVMGDQGQIIEYERRGGKLEKHKGLFTTHASGRKAGTRIVGRISDVKHFSFDALEGFYLNNTICSFGLQLAVWMGANPIYLVGIDAHGRHFYGGPNIPDQKFANQRETYGLIAGILRCERPELKVINLNMNSCVRVFPKKRFEEVFP